MARCIWAPSGRPVRLVLGPRRCRAAAVVRPVSRSEEWQRVTLMAGRTWFTLVFAVLLVACSGGGGDAVTEEGDEETAAEEGEYPSEDLRIMAPADPGGGWDSTARAMQQVLDGGVIEQGVEVYNVGGAGGTVGLAQFASDSAGDPHELMVMGLVMVGAIRTNDSPVSLDDVTPIATLTTEYEAVAVPADSEYQTMEDLVEAFRADPGSISWAGGSAGGTDHILVGLIAQAAGVDPSQINYVAHSGGGEALADVLSGAATAGVSGVSEFADQVEAGQMRFLAVSSPEPIEGIDAATISDSGLDVELANWRGVVAAPGIDDEQREQIVGMIERMRDSDGWQEALEANGWTDFLQPGEEFDAFLDEEATRVEAVLSDIGLTE